MTTSAPAGIAATLPGPGTPLDELAAGRPIRAGVVGVGFMGQVHVRAIRAAGGHVATLAAARPGRAREVAARLGTTAAPSLEALLADPGIDVVHVCTPNVTHEEIALAALDAGKHVVCEKPLASPPDAARAIHARAEATGLTVTVPFVYRFHPMVREALALVASGALGDLHSLRCCYLQDWLLEAGDDDWRVDSRLGGPSRAFADIGSHLCDLVEFITGQRIVSLAARTRTVLGRRAGRTVDTEDLAAVLFETDRGVLGTALVSQMAAGRKNHLSVEVMGTAGSVAFDQEQPETLWLGRRSGSRTLDRDAALLSPDAARLSIVPVGHPMGYQDAFNAFVADAYRSIRGEKPFGLPTSADGVRAADLTAAVLDSAASGRWVSLTPRGRDIGPTPPP